MEFTTVCNKMKIMGEKKIIYFASKVERDFVFLEIVWFSTMI